MASRVITSLGITTSGYGQTSRIPISGVPLKQIHGCLMDTIVVVGLKVVIRRSGLVTKGPKWNLELRQKIVGSCPILSVFICVYRIYLFEWVILEYTRGQM